ncbi:hypothetical protein [Catellatospora sp. NPDC049609]
MDVATAYEKVALEQFTADMFASEAQVIAAWIMRAWCSGRHALDRSAG